MAVKSDRWRRQALRAVLAGIFAVAVPSINWATDDLPRDAGSNASGKHVVLGSPEGIIVELNSLRSQIEELQRRDEDKTRQIDELRRQLDDNQIGPSLGRGPSGDTASVLGNRLRVQDKPAGQQQESALDKAIRELQHNQAPGQQQESPLDKAIRELQGNQPSGQSALEQAVQGLPAPQQPIVSVPVGGARLQLMDISMDGLFAAGTSTETEPSILQLQGGDHDPHKRGFTVQNVELFLQGAVDPYIDAATNIVYKIDELGESTVELEEAYFVTRAWPCGLQWKAGQYFTEFGRLNPQHPHSWQWIDDSIINSRIFGADGMRGPGMRISKLLECSHFSEVYFDVHNANGETQTSFFSSEEVFAERAPGGRPFVPQDVRDLGDLVYTVRWENGWSSGCEEEYNWLLGFSGSFGPNATGPDGRSEVYGADLTMKWKPAKNERGWPFVIWESEFIFRHYRADNFRRLGDLIDPTDDIVLEGRTLQDWGFWSEVLYGCKPKYAVGLRYEFAGGSGSSLDEDFNLISRQDDPFRDDRHRLSPLIAFYPTEFSRFRLQYNYDHAQHLGSDAHSVWFGMEWLIGSHPAHKF
jgi:hypothetical protein